MASVVANTHGLSHRDSTGNMVSSWLDLPTRRIEPVCNDLSVFHSITSIVIRGRRIDCVSESRIRAPTGCLVLGVANQRRSKSKDED